MPVKPIAELSEDAQKVAYAIIELYRAAVFPTWEPARFRDAAVELLDNGLAHFVERADEYKFELTADGVRVMSGGRLDA